MCLLRKGFSAIHETTIGEVETNLNEDNTRRIEMNKAFITSEIGRIENEEDKKTFLLLESTGHDVLESYNACSRLGRISRSGMGSLQGWESFENDVTEPNLSPTPSVIDVQEKSTILEVEGTRAETNAIGIEALILENISWSEGSRRGAISTR